MSFFAAIRIFDPYQVAVMDSDMSVYLSDIPELKDVGSDWAVYLGVAKDYSETVEQDENNLLKFWNVHRLSIPKLYELSK